MLAYEAQKIISEFQTLIVPNLAKKEHLAVVYLNLANAYFWASEFDCAEN